MLREITMWIVAFGIIPSLGFVLLYGLTSPWWKSPGGRHLMSFAAAAFLLFVWVFLTLIFDEFTGRHVLRLTVAGSFVALAWWRFIVLLRLHFGFLREYFNGDDATEGEPRRRPYDPPLDL